MSREDFCVFILSHGRPQNVKTHELVRRLGYTGKLFVVCDNEDDTLQEYYDAFGEEVVVFNKAFYLGKLDGYTNTGERNNVLYARNACFDLAEELGFKYFCELDDDYYYFGQKHETESSCYIYDLDTMFNLFVDFLESTPTTSIAFAQGGDLIGGLKGKPLVKRKAMNSFFCSTEKRFDFYGIFNDDVNTYVGLGKVGKLFFSVQNLIICPYASQSLESGITDAYMKYGTYVKSFMSVIANPSCVKINTMGISSKRLHHSIAWNNAVPCILREEHKKK